MNKDIMDLLWEIQKHHGDFRIDPDSILCISEESKKRISMWQQ